MSTGIFPASSTIPELYSDPVSPSPQQAWVLATASGGGLPIGNIGIPIGLLLTLTQPGSGFTPITYTYQFSYRTFEGTTNRVTIS